MSYSVNYIISEEKQVGGEIKYLHWEVCQKKKNLYILFSIAA